MLKSKDEIKDWLDIYKGDIVDYQINDDLTVSAKSVHLLHLDLDYIPVKFYEVENEFHVTGNNLSKQNLDFLPRKAWYMNMPNNRITSLATLPSDIHLNKLLDHLIVFTRNPIVELSSDLESRVFGGSYRNDSGHRIVICGEPTSVSIDCDRFSEIERNIKLKQLTD
jgi:hypothetical protein